MATEPAATPAGMGDTLLSRLDESRLSSRHWYWTTLAALADFLDAGSIVAGSAALAFWVKEFHLSSNTVGLIAAFSSNGISTGVGAWVGGWLGDRLGRKFIYTTDLLLYAVGALVIVFANGAPMVIAGYMLVGFAVGADIPTSWSLIAEFAPKRRRGALMGMTNVFWYIGPIVILLLSIGWAGLGALGGRLLFAVLCFVAVVTWFLRRQIAESPRWAALAGARKHMDDAERLVARQRAGAGEPGAEQGTEPSAAPAPRQVRGRNAVRLLTSGSSLRAFAFVTPIYVLWGLAAGTYGFFLPYILHSLGGHSAVASDALDMLWFGSAIVTVVFVFMPLNDRVDRRLLYAASAAMMAVSFYMLVFFPISNTVVAVVSILLFGLGQGVGLWPLQRIWSVELFPTPVRATAQGILWGVMRVLLGIWSLYFATFTAVSGFTIVAIVLGSFFAFNMIVGGLFGPRTQGKSLEAISA
jgi:MFS transporter, SP family, inositol transporter